MSKEVFCGNLDFRHLRKLSDEKAIDAIEDQVGIGLWSSRVFLFDGLHRLSTYPIFDITIQRALTMLKGPKEQMNHSRIDWSSFGPESLAGFYATYLFAYFREMMKVVPES